MATEIEVPAFLNWVVQAYGEELAQSCERQIAGAMRMPEHILFALLHEIRCAPMQHAIDASIAGAERACDS